jgi:Fe-S-cluster containining protein
MTSEYRALIAKVEAFTQATFTRRRDDFACSAGCAACCHAWLSVSAVEADQVRAGLAALPPAARADVRQRGQRELARAANEEQPPRCAMLGDDDRCAIYEARPLVCRTQGHALRYPSGLIPSDAITRRTEKGDLTWCPLNYDAAEPNAEDVLDAERVDQILAVVAARHAVAHGVDREARFELSALAVEMDVLHDDTARHGPLDPSTPHRDTDD